MNVPNHIAIIMDGNGRWAQQLGKKRFYGHYIGAQVVDKIVVKAKEIGIKFITLYAFSTENWKRPKNEVNFLMRLLYIQMQKKAELMKNEDIKFGVIGDIYALPDRQKEAVLNLQEKTKNNKSITMNFAINYGAKLEIINACKTICQEVIEGKIEKDKIDAQVFNQHLYTKDTPDVDLLIRTGGEKRISNFLLWQCAYAEFIFLDKYWPEFNEDDLVNCILEFGERKRRFGSLDD